MIDFAHPLKIFKFEEIVIKLVWYEKKRLIKHMTQIDLLRYFTLLLYQSRRIGGLTVYTYQFQLKVYKYYGLYDYLISLILFRCHISSVLIENFRRLIHTEFHYNLPFIRSSITLWRNKNIHTMYSVHKLNIV